MAPHCLGSSWTGWGLILRGALLARIAPVALILVIVIAWNFSHPSVYPGWRSGADVLLYLVGHHALPVP